ncbi:MAG: DUF1800 domain-containing protein [Tepidisphaeraceae bacterium]
MFEPFEPSDAQPWGMRRIGHLLRRAGFGATDDWVDALKPATPADALSTLLEYDVADDPLNPYLDKLEGYLTFGEPKSVQGWWVFRMLNTTRPMQEKIALFWHNHFATSAGKVTNIRLMHQQIELFRRMGLGSFRDLLIEVGKDPAMLIWLDGNTNQKGKPNENYAREVMELFTLGIGTYTEKDVKELSRAFTGWQIQGDKGRLNPSLFDDGEKEIFGKRDRIDAEGAVDLLLERPTAPKFIARKLLREFVHPAPTDAMIDHYGRRLVASKWEVKPVLREMLASRLFFSDWAYRSRIKSPIELSVGAVAALGGKVNTGFVRDSSAKMGQDLLFPPNVKGWDGGEAWINANTVLMRFNFGLSLATQRNNEFARPSDIQAWISRHNIKSAEDAVDQYCRLFLDGEVTADVREKFVAYLKSDPKGNVQEKIKLDPGMINSKVRGLLHLIMSTPEYQLA